MGSPLGVFQTWWQYRQLNYGVSDLFTPHGIGLMYVCFFFATAITYAYGAIEWNRREGNYQKRHKPQDRGAPDDGDD